MVPIAPLSHVRLRVRYTPGLLLDLLASFGGRSFSFLLGATDDDSAASLSSSSSSSSSMLLGAAAGLTDAGGDVRGLASEHSSDIHRSSSSSAFASPLAALFSSASTTAAQLRASLATLSTLDLARLNVLLPYLGLPPASGEFAHDIEIENELEGANALLVALSGSLSFQARAAGVEVTMVCFCRRSSGVGLAGSSGSGWVWGLFSRLCCMHACCAVEPTHATPLYDRSRPRIRPDTVQSDKSVTDFDFGDCLIGVPICRRFVLRNLTQVFKAAFLSHFCHACTAQSLIAILVSSKTPYFMSNAHFQDTMEIRLSSDIGSEIHFELDETDASAPDSTSTSSSLSSAASSLAERERDRDRDRDRSAAATSAASGALIPTDRTHDQQLRDDAGNADVHSDDEAAENEHEHEHAHGHGKDEIGSDIATLGTTRRRRVDFAVKGAASASSHESQATRYAAGGDDETDQTLHDAGGQERQPHAGAILVSSHACIFALVLY